MAGFRLSFSLPNAHCLMPTHLGFLTGDGFHFGQQVAEFSVVDFDAIVEVEFDALVGVVAELVVEGLEFLTLLDQLVSFSFERFAVAGAIGSGDVVF